MSRILIFDLDNRAAGEIHANCDRSWLINESGQTEITLAAEQVLPALQFGRMILVEHPKLSAWAGVIDTPWTATLPVRVTAYNAGYLLHLRSPQAARTLTGSTGAVVTRLLQDAQAEEDSFLRPGEIDMDDTSQTVPCDRRDYWTQILELVTRSGYELQIRPAVDVDHRLFLYLDVQKRLGIDTDALLHDGSGGNMQIVEATVDGELWNAVTGYGSQQMPVSGDPQTDEELIALYRRRSRMVQYKEAGQSELNRLAGIDLDRHKRPVLKLTVNVLDVGEIFSHLQLGNSLLVRASVLYLPGGVRGWVGYGRITAMAYSEQNNTVSISLEAKL